MLARVADRLKLYVVPASHPCAAVERTLQLKGLEYDRIDQLPLVHMVQQQLRFGRRTVPGVIFPDGTRVVGSRPILRVLEGLQPQPPLLPADVDQRARVEAAEAWGDEVLQPLGRRIVWAALARDPSALTSYAEGYDLPLPTSLAARSAGLVIPLERLVNRAPDEQVRRDLHDLPAHLDRLDAWIAEGVIGGDQPNVADLQLLSTVRLLDTLGDLAPIIDDRPAGAAARALFPTYPGALPAGTLPADWLAR
jgi:glutathione S-transferase